MKRVLSVEWIADGERSLVPGRIRILDQTRLPTETVFFETVDPKELLQAIRSLKVRGAPAIGVCAAMGVAAAAQQAGEETREILESVDHACESLAAARPTAVNLFWALDRMKRAAHGNADLSAEVLKERLAAEAAAIRNEDAAMCREIGRHGAELIKGCESVLTHCNAGALATAEFGTALAPIYVSIENGRHIRVFVDETRPLLQGSRLTAWELQQAGVEVTLICDNAAAQVMKEGRVDAVLVGADRIAANGDTANKIGTYGVATLAKAHGIPFYVLAPTSTFDPLAPNGDAIPIETRGSEEITAGFGRRTAPEGVEVYAPAFDVTPAPLITAIVCEKGVVRPVNAANIAGVAGQALP